MCKRPLDQLMCQGEKRHAQVCRSVKIGLYGPGRARFKFDLEKDSAETG